MICKNSFYGTSRFWSLSELFSESWKCYFLVSMLNHCMQTGSWSSNIMYCGSPVSSKMTTY